MTTLTPSATALLQAVFGMGILTAVMAVWMTVARTIGMNQAGLDLSEGEHTVNLRSKLPSSVQRVGDNYNHLFETPTLFYAVAIAIVVAGISDPIHATCGWVFLAARVAHSLVQATINRMPLRILFYTVSWMALFTMIVRGVSTL